MTSPHDDEATPDELNELVLHRTEVDAEYTDLQAQLQSEREPTRVVGLLRDLASLRTELARIDDELLELAPAPNPPTEAEAAEAEADPADERDGAPEPDLSTTVLVRPGALRSGDGSDAARTVDEASGFVTVVEEPAGADREPADRPLSLRILIEGPAGAGVTTVLSQLGPHFGTRRQRATAKAGNLAVELHEFEAGPFEGQDVAFEVIRLSGDAGRNARRYLRSMVDAIIVVIDARPSATTRSLGHISELLDEQREVPIEHRPAVTVFANKSDLEDALDADWITAALPADGVVQVVATSRDQGFLFGFVRATNAGIRRARRRVADGLVRTRPLGFDGLLRLLSAQIERHGGPANGRARNASHDGGAANGASRRRGSTLWGIISPRRVGGDADRPEGGHGAQPPQFPPQFRAG